MGFLTKRFLLLGALLGTAMSAQAGLITEWNTNNVETDPGPYTDGETYYSTIYDQDVSGGTAGAATNGRIAFEPPEGAAPGLKVVNDGPDLNPNRDFNDCIMAAGDTTCESGFQSGKRFKMHATDTGAVDLVFNVEPSEGTTNYRVFHKLSNFTGGQLSGMEVQLGYGTGSSFQPSGNGDGLGFVTNIEETDVREGAFYPFGLFGDADEHPHHTLSGFFDTESRAGYDLTFGEDSLVTGDMYGMYDDFFGNWLANSQVPDGYFWDHDNDPATEDILMAYLNEDGEWIQRREEDNGEAIPTEAFATTEAALQEAGYYRGVIEDLANLNLNYFLSVGDLSTFENSDLTAQQELPSGTFTMRVSTNAVQVPAPQTVGLLLGGLFLLLASRRLSLA